MKIVRRRLRAGARRHARIRGRAGRPDPAARLSRQRGGRGAGRDDPPHGLSRRQPSLCLDRARRPRTPPMPASSRCIWTRTIMPTECAHFSTIDNGTAIAVYKGALYAAVAQHALSLRAVGERAGADVAARNRDRRRARPRRHRFRRQGRALSSAIGGGGNVCAPPGTPRTAKSVGLRPCPDLETRAGVWRFDAAKSGQKLDAWRALRHRHPRHQRAGLRPWHARQP